MSFDRQPLPSFCSPTLCNHTTSPTSHVTAPHVTISARCGLSAAIVPPPPSTTSFHPPPHHTTPTATPIKIKYPVREDRVRHILYLSASPPPPPSPANYPLRCVAKHRNGKGRGGLSPFPPPQLSSTALIFPLPPPHTHPPFFPLISTNPHSSQTHTNQKHAASPHPHLHQPTRPPPMCVRQVFFVFFV